MVGDHDRSARALEALAARGRDCDLAIEQGLGGRTAERDQQLRLHERDLAIEIRLAGGDLAAFWSAVVWRSALDRICDIDVFSALQPDRREHVVEQAPGLADEGLATLVLLRARRLAHQHPACLAVAHAGHGLLAALAQPTGLAIADLGFERVPFERGDAGAASRIRRRRRNANGCGRRSVRGLGARGTVRAGLERNARSRSGSPGRCGWGRIRRTRHLDPGRGGRVGFGRCRLGRFTLRIIRFGDLRLPRAQAPDRAESHLAQHRVAAGGQARRHHSARLITIASSRPPAAG